MQDEYRLTPAEMELEAALKGLTPAASQGLRDRVMFKAGYVRGRRGNHLWQGVAACLGVMLVVATAWSPAPVPRQVLQDRMAADTGHTPQQIERVRQPVVAGEGLRYSHVREYLGLRKAVLERGMDALPAWRPVPYSVRRVSLSEDCMDEILASI